ncbi:MAG: thiamine phosphate synthase [Devosiaceae bacterium]|nr:thiamine phosphate synthase [Devosiaceae bacterium MH13]
MALSDYRSRLFLIAPDDPQPAFADQLSAALSGGDVACVLLTPSHDAALNKALVQQGQDAGAAVLIADDTPAAGRLGADGVHLSQAKAMDDATLAKWQDGGSIVGTAGINTRHLALDTGERGFDYLFFGRTDREQEPETHPKTTALATWWAEVMAVPCVAFSGTSSAAFEALAHAGVEFIAVRDEVWTATDPAEAVRTLNSALDRIAQLRMEAAA